MNPSNSSALPARRSSCLAALATLLALGLSACQSQVSAPAAPLQVVNDKSLIFIADSNFDPSRLPPEWWRSPAGRTEGFTMTRLGGAPVLRIESPAGLLLGRRFDAPMAERPFLRWSWYLDPAIYQGSAADNQPRGLRLVLGFRGGAARDSFDRLLKAALSSAGADAGEVHPDAEVLAGWFERTLDANTMGVEIGRAHV